MNEFQYLHDSYDFDAVERSFDSFEEDLLSLGWEVPVLSDEEIDGFWELFLQMNIHNYYDILGHAIYSRYALFLRTSANKKARLLVIFDLVLKEVVVWQLYER